MNDSYEVENATYLEMPCRCDVRIVIVPLRLWRNDDKCDEATMRVTASLNSDACCHAFRDIYQLRKGNQVPPVTV